MYRMEDTKVCKGHYAYMFRVDLSCNQEASSRIEEWLELKNFTNWTGCHEVGEETGKHHYQMCIWREHKFSQKEQVKARNWWRNKTNSEKNGCALTSARKILSLASYSKKDQNSKLFSTICNLSSNQLERIPKWESKRAVKVKRDEKFKSTVLALGNTLTLDEFLCQINSIYVKIYGRCCTYKNTYINLLYQNGYLKDKNIVRLTMGLHTMQDLMEIENERQTGLEFDELYENQQMETVTYYLGKSA